MTAPTPVRLRAARPRASRASTTRGVDARAISRDTVLAQGGFVGHRDGFRSNEGGFLGDATGSIIPPIFPSTTYARVGSSMGYDLRHMSTPRHRDVISDLVPHDDDAFGDFFTKKQTRHQTEDKKHPLMYSRPDNPTYTRAESVLASLEGGADAALFSSGMAAVSAVASAVFCAPAIAPRFPKTATSPCAFFSRSGASDTAWTACCTTARSKATSKTRCAAWITRRTPPATASASCCGSRRRPTPPGQRDGYSRRRRRRARVRRRDVLRRHGFDAISVSSADVRRGLGHAQRDEVLERPLRRRGGRGGRPKNENHRGERRRVVGGVGADAGSDAFPKVWDRLLRARSFGGSVLGPFEAWLLLRGMRTLHVRVRAQCATAAALANKLRSHPCVAAVYYPGLETHPGHAVARAQQSSPFSFSANTRACGSNDQKMFGGMLSVRCVGGGKAAVMTTSMTKVWFPATSLGGVESLVEHRKTVEGPSSGTPDDLLRLSVGLEHADDLYRDLSEALWDAHGRIASSAKRRKTRDARKESEENGG